MPFRVITDVPTVFHALPRSRFERACAVGWYASSSYMRTGAMSCQPSAERIIAYANERLATTSVAWVCMELAMHRLMALVVDRSSAILAGMSLRGPVNMSAVVSASAMVRDSQGRFRGLTALFYSPPDLRASAAGRHIPVTKKGKLSQ